ncbi:MAG: hypothetical protein WGN25_03105 [Candidatus Electrothrix sp. GW3-4]|uniref:hypothetical protein n=1 Tax=Candidatus Electrothrix sp. GW3-4 TaxID=3126740 RepID=UPI0030D1644E
MQFATEKKTTQLVEALAKIAESGQVNLIQLQSFKQNAQQLRNASVPDSDMIYGAIASIEGDENEMRRRHKNSIAYSGGDAFYIGNYAASLWNMLFVKEAADKFYEAFLKSDRTALKDLHSAISLTLVSGYIKEAHSVFQKHAGLLLSSQNHISSNLVGLQAIYDASQDGSFDLDSFKLKMNIVFERMRSKGMRGVKHSVSKEEIDDESWWRLTFCAHLREDEIIDLECDINEQLTAQDLDCIEDGFVEILIESRDSEYQDLLEKIDKKVEMGNLIPLNVDLINRAQEALN